MVAYYQALVAAFQRRISGPLVAQAVLAVMQDLAVALVAAVAGVLLVEQDKVAVLVVQVAQLFQELPLRQ